MIRRGTTIKEIKGSYKVLDKKAEHSIPIIKLNTKQITSFTTTIRKPQPRKNSFVVTVYIEYRDG